MLVTHQLRQFRISCGGLTVIVRRRLLAERVGQGCGYFLQSVMSEIAFGGQISQPDRQPKLVWRYRQLPDLQRELLGNAAPDVVGQLTQTMDLVGDWLFLSAP